MRWLVIVAGLWLATLNGVQAHESQPASLELREVAPDRVEVTWRTPLMFGQRHPARLQLPPEWSDAQDTLPQRQARAFVERRHIDLGDTGIDGRVIRFPGLEQTITDVFVRLTRLDGTTTTSIVRPAQPWIELRGERSWTANIREYLTLGIQHILLGMDHLLFVLGLLLIVSGKGALIQTITAFTLAHSLTLALATLTELRLPLAPLNAAVALSILFLGPEIVRRWRGQDSLTLRFPWMVAFLFGLLHGFGFASGLSLSGLPQAEIPQALLWFNVGVEFGQLAFVLLALVMAKAFRILAMQWPLWVQRMPGYLVGTCGAYWTLDRSLVLFMPPLL